MSVIECDESHADAILAIFNDAIATSTALYDYKPRTPETMRVWFETKRRGEFPVLGLLSSDTGELMGFASYGTFRGFPGYKYTVEHSLYVAKNFRGRGVGKRLLSELIASAEQQGYHTLIGVIDSANVVSRTLHERFGFSMAGQLSQVGFKFGRWLDVCFYQKLLTGPQNPCDG